MLIPKPIWLEQVYMHVFGSWHMLWFLFTVVDELVSTSKGLSSVHLHPIENTCTPSPSSYDSESHSENAAESELTGEDASDLRAAVNLSLQSKFLLNIHNVECFLIMAMFENSWYTI